MAVAAVLAAAVTVTVNGLDCFVIGIGVWFVAITTGCDAAIAACPNAGIFVLTAERVVSVAAPAGNGSDTALTGWVA